MGSHQPWWMAPEQPQGSSTPATGSLPPFLGGAPTSPAAPFPSSSLPFSLHGAAPAQAPFPEAQGRCAVSSFKKVAKYK